MGRATGNGADGTAENGTGGPPENGTDAAADDGTNRPTEKRRLLALLAVGLAPWTVYQSGDLVFAWGLVSTSPFGITSLPEYLFVLTAGLPRRLLAWPVAVVLYALAVASAVLGSVTPRAEDRRVTGGLLAFAGLSDLWFALGTTRPGLLAVPTGTVLLWVVAWWFHWPDLRAAFAPRDRGS